MKRLLPLLLSGLLWAPWVPAREHAWQQPVLAVQPPEALASESGLTLERQHWSLGGAGGWCWRARLPLPGSAQVRAGTSTKTLDAIVPGNDGPWALVNGGFYDVDGEAMGLVVADSVIQAPYRLGGGSGIFEYRDGVPAIVHRSQYRRGAEQALQSIDRIVADSRTLVTPRPGRRVAARAAVALSERELWLVLCADERSVSGQGDELRIHLPSGLGMPLWAFAQYLETTTGATDALNLDGSVSAQFAANIGDRKLRIRALRGSINALVIRP